MKERRTRQAALLKLVRRRRLANQEEMATLLRNQGFQVTQASISRDVRELGLVRVDGCYIPASRVTTLGDANGLGLHSSELIVSIEPIGANLVVIKTPPGGAATVAVELDGKNVPEIAGTVAGDDTVFVAVRSRAAQGRVLALFKGAPSGHTNAGPDGQVPHTET